MTRGPSCEERIDADLESTLQDIRRIWDLQTEGQDPDEDLGRIEGYGLCFDYVEPETFRDQTVGYWRWQLSTGGPQTEFRLYDNGRLTYAFLDWFDGATRNVDDPMITEIMDYFLEMTQ